ncbi:MAG: response regulator [Actinomycetales bacterium]|nr:response regulator [Actinomycetales bacterium]
MTSTILAVDDEDAIADLICDALSLAGYRTVRAGHGMEALRLLRETPIDLVVLDISMPTMDGFEVLERMRSIGDHRPVIILTARQDRQDVHRGFELGADDFVRKPFGIEELTMRVAAVLRRSHPEGENTVLRVGDVTMDAAAHVVRVHGDELYLSPTEFRLLAVLMGNPDRVLARAQLLGQVWGLEEGAESTALETYVSYLRRKLGDALAIRTVRGVGYQLVSPGRAR